MPWASGVNQLLSRAKLLEEQVSEASYSKRDKLLGEEGNERILEPNMQKNEHFFLFAVLTAAACGGRTEVEGLSSSSNVGGLSAAGGTGSSPSTGGSTSTGAATCPSTWPKVGDPCQPEGLYCKYDNAMCLIAYQCSASAQFEWAGNCLSLMGGTGSTGGTPATGGRSSSTGGSNTEGGTTPTGGSLATGCTGSFEMPLGNRGLCVAKMVPITGPKGGPNMDYKIDATEVTKGQYDVWLATNPPLPASTDLNCGYVKSYSEQSTNGTYTGPDADHHPVVYVDWCDAYEYCLGVDKRLCGAIGGGSVDYNTGFVDATVSQWYRACSSGGAVSYPYGNT